MVCALLFVVLFQITPNTQVGQEARNLAEAFFQRNNATVPPISVNALAAFIEASRAYRSGDYVHCLRTLDALWQTYPIGSSVWGDARESTSPTISISYPHCYYSLLMLDEACRWKLDPTSRAVSAKPILLEIVLFGHSKGIQPRSTKELEERSGAEVVKDLEPGLRKEDYRRLRNCTWLFQEYILAITKGRANLALEFTTAPDVMLPVVTTKSDRAFSTPNPAAMKEALTAIKSQLKIQPDWWWTIYPSMVPDKYPDFVRTEFVTGGMGSGPDGLSPRFEIDDQWFIRRPPHMGKGPYEEMEIETYIPNWLQHEFSHHLFARYPGFGLEKSSHQWFDRTTWPSDFVGIFEADYYREALHRRIQPSGIPPIHIQLRYAGPLPKLLQKISATDLIGTYKHLPATNGWHVGKLSYNGTGKDRLPVLQWTNAANVSWHLSPHIESGVLLTGPDNPYANEKSGSAHEFSIVLKRDTEGNYTTEVAGFNFNGEFYAKD